MEDRGRILKLLLDTNVILESLLMQGKAQEAEALFLKNQEHDLYLSDFALHSIGAVLSRRKKYADFCELIGDIVEGTGIQVLSLSEKELEQVVEVAQKYGLDFDDAYQYAVAEKYNLTLVSFDKDFDRTERGRKTPSEILKG